MNRPATAPQRTRTHANGVDSLTTPRQRHITYWISAGVGLLALTAGFVSNRMDTYNRTPVPACAEPVRDGDTKGTIAHQDQDLMTELDHARLVTATGEDRRPGSEINAGDTFLLGKAACDALVALNVAVYPVPPELS